MAQGILEVNFLPQANAAAKLTIANCIVDTPKFSSMFPASLITDYLGSSNTHGVVDIRLEAQTILSSLGAKQFTLANLLQIIGTKTIEDVTGATNLIVFFYNKTVVEKNSNWFAQLIDAAFIMDDSGCFKTAKEIFIPSQIETAREEETFDGIGYVHPDILRYFEEHKFVIEWLLELGVREPTNVEIVKKALIPMIQSDRVSLGNVLKVTRFIFKVYKSKELSQMDLEQLKNLKLLSGKELKNSFSCYLSGRYTTATDLSSVIPNGNFVSEDYIENSQDTVEWKDFFKIVGARDQLSIDVIEETTERAKFEDLYPESESYFSWLEKTEAFPSIYHSYRYSGQHYIKNFTAIEFREHLKHPVFSKIFWTRMINSWDQFYEKCTATRYYYRGGNVVVPSFIQYFLKNFTSVSCTDDKCYKSSEVFSPALKSVIGNFMPVADLTTTITVEQINFFGFKKNLSVIECLQLLEKISAQTPSSEINKQIFSIYEILINQSSTNDTEVKNYIVKWRNSARILTNDNTFQPVKEVFVLSVSGITTPVNSARFVKLPLNKSFDEINALSELLLIPVITFGDLEFVPKGHAEDKVMQSILLRRASYLALIHAHNSSENYELVISRLNVILKSTRFLQAESLSLIYRATNEDLVVNAKIEAWNDKKGEFYFVGRWNSPLTLYGLSNSICVFLDLKNMEREFGLIMQLNEEDILEWLLDKGYRINLLDEVVVPAEINDYDPFEEIELEEEPMSESFLEEVKVIDIDFRNVSPVRKTLEESSSAPKNTYQKIKDQQVKLDIGRWAEEYVFRYFQQNKEIFTTIIWLNEKEESYQPYDFEVIENGVTRFIEVKGTPSTKKEVIYLSQAEWQILFAKKDSYSIFRVLGVGTANCNLERTDYLSSLIVEGKVLAFPLELAIT